MFKWFEWIARSASNYNRQKKYNLFLSYFNPTMSTKILDVGASEKEYQKNANIIEKNYPYPENITALGIEKYKNFLERYPKVQTIIYNGETFPFQDKTFEICWSNAVIEHVGDRDKQINFIKEVSRVAKSAFITTPNKFFPLEVHTKIFLLHFLPKKYFDKILTKIGKSYACGNYMHLLSLRCIKKILSENNISNYRIIKNKMLFFTIDFVIIF